MTIIYVRSSLKYQDIMNRFLNLNTRKMSKLKLNFATRVASPVMMKSENSNAFNAERAKVQASVNANPVKIDRSIFKKTEIEKLELANAKAQWKKTLV